MKREVLQLKREMNNTSSQDEFAKWAKLRRRHDKSLEEYETMSTCFWLGPEDFPPINVFMTDKAVSTEKTSFDWSVKTARWLSTNGLKIFLQFYYSKTPVFALPAGWFPYYIEWILSFPRAPLGSVSIQVWSNVCATAIAVVAEFIGALLVQILGQKRSAVPVGTEGNEAKKTQ